MISRTSNVSFRVGGIATLERHRLRLLLLVLSLCVSDTLASQAALPPKASAANPGSAAPVNNSIFSTNSNTKSNNNYDQDSGLANSTNSHSHPRAFVPPSKQTRPSVHTSKEQPSPPQRAPQQAATTSTTTAQKELPLRGGAVLKGLKMPPQSSPPRQQSSQQQPPHTLREEHTTEKDPRLHATYIADTKLPTDMGDFRMRAYRVTPATAGTSATGSSTMYDNTNAMEPIVLYAADKPPFGTHGQLQENVPVRIHDQCLTSEVFRSRRCDCKEQLKLSMEYIQQHGGAVIYLQQEGRGIGLANKVAAYELQDSGYDTVDANLQLGFPADARQYGVLPSILRHMHVASIRLMTNNPRKVQRLGALGITIVGTIPIVAPANDHNRHYLTTKHERMDHMNFGHLNNQENDRLPVQHGISNQHHQPQQ